MYHSFQTEIEKYLFCLGGGLFILNMKVKKN